MRDKEIVGITMGDPAGVGPEIIVKALSQEEFYRISSPVVMGEETVLRRAIDLVGKNSLKINCIKEVKEAKGKYGIIDLLNLDNIKANSVNFGQVNAECGRAAIEYINKAVALALIILSSLSNKLFSKTYSFTIFPRGVGMIVSYAP